MKRLNITIPNTLAERMKDVPNKSGLITEALQEKLRRIEKEKLDRLLVEGYRATRKEDKAMDEGWEKITLEGWK